MTRPPKPIEIKPSMGGRLLSGLSADNAGLANWTIKRDFRRDKDLEVLSEGYDRFAPDPLNPGQPPVGGDPITLIAMGRRQNGATAVIVGTATTIWRYFGKDNGAYATDYYTSYPDGAPGGEPYVNDAPGTWVQIGGGFSANGRRWEALSVGGYLVLNNAVDLPVTYRIEEMAVKPIYELREQGVASVGSIAEHRGILVCLDIKTIKDAKLQRLLYPIPCARNLSQAGVSNGSPCQAKVNSGVDTVAGNTITLDAVNLIPGGAHYAGFNYSIQVVPGQVYTLVTDGTEFLVTQGTVVAGAFLNAVTLHPVAGVPYQFTALDTGAASPTDLFPGVRTYELLLTSLNFNGAFNSKLFVGGGAFLGANGFLGKVGSTVRLANGLQRTITAAASQTVATVNGAAVVNEPYQPLNFPSVGGDEFKVALDLNLDLVASAAAATVNRAQQVLTKVQAARTASQAAQTAALANLTAAQAALLGANGITAALEGSLTTAQKALTADPGNVDLRAAVTATESALDAARNTGLFSSAVSATQAAYDAAVLDLQGKNWAVTEAQTLLGLAQASQLVDNAELVANFTDLTKLVGLRIFWDSGEVRTIVGTYNAGVLVDADQPIPAGPCSLENPLAYLPVADGADIERYPWRMLWSMPELPRRFGAVTPCTVDPGSNFVTLSYPARSVEELVNAGGASFLIPWGAGDGGNLTIGASMSYGVVVLADAAAITEANATVQAGITAAQNAVDAASQAIAAATSKLATAQQAVGRQEAAAEAAVDGYAGLKQTLDDAQLALDKANVTLGVAQADFDTAQTALDADPTNAAKQAAQQKAQVTLDATANAVSAAQTIYTNAKAAIPDYDTLNGDVVAANTAVTTAQADITAASGQLIAAEAQLTAAQEKALPTGTSMQAADAAGSITGKFQDLIGDGTGLLRAMTLGKVLMIYGEHAVFMAVYTESTAAPFQFDKIEIPAGTGIFYRNTLAQVIGLGLYGERTQHHIYVGRNAFYRFDLTNRTPMQIQEFQPCQDILFSGASDDNAVFVANNPATKELFFCFPANAAGDGALRYDYQFNTVATTAMPLTAAMAVNRPEGEIVPVQAEEWFVMALAGQANVYRYGLVATASVAGVSTCSKAKGSNVVTASAGFFTDRMVGRSILTTSGKLLAISAYTDPTHVTVIGDANMVISAEAFKVIAAIYHRDGQPYDGVLQSGLQALGGADGEAALNGYVPVLSSDSPDVPLQIALRGGVNPGNGKDILSTTVASPQTRNLVTIALVQRYVGDRIKVSGVNHLVKVAARILRMAGVPSESFNRHS